MLFNTIDFAIFLPVVVVCYYLIPFKYRWILLLSASYFFYMSWRVEYIGLIILSTLVDYISGIRMARLPDRRSRRPWLILSLVTNLGFYCFTGLDCPPGSPCRTSCSLWVFHFILFKR